MYQTNKQVEEELDKFAGDLVVAFIPDGDGDETNLYLSEASGYEELKAKFLSQRAKDLEGIEEWVEKKLSGDTEPLFRLGGLIIDNEKMQMGTIMGQKKAFSDILSYLKSLKQTNE
jgi:hypothetical protein